MRSGHNQRMPARKAVPPSAGAGSSLSERERRDVAERSAPRALVVFETIRREGDNELQRPFISLAASGLAAGLSMGFSLVTTGLLRALLPDAPWRPLVENFGYTIGFLIVVMGRQQLFTENTLTVVLPFLDGPDKRKTALQVLRVWAIVLVANLVGAAAFAAVVAHTGVFAAPVRDAFAAIGRDAAAPPFALLLLRGVFAGWLIALMVWLLPAADAARPWIIVIITYIVGVAALSHVVAGSVEVLYTVAAGERSIGAFLGGFLLPVLIGNTIGGVALVALLNYGQVVAEGRPSGER
jgi:formate-nitrite transporter family protein